MEVINSLSSAEGKQGQKASLNKGFFRHFRSSARSPRKNKSSRSNLLSKTSGQENVNVLPQSTQENNGVVRMKILVRKKDLEQVLELMRNSNSNTTQNNSTAEEDEEASLLIEERLNLLGKKKHRRHNSWIPALHTIPEELLAY